VSKRCVENLEWARERYAVFDERTGRLHLLRESGYDRADMSEKEARKRWEKSIRNTDMVFVEIRRIARRKNIAPEFVIEECGE
jgi:hypothetical protein